MRLILDQMHRALLGFVVTGSVMGIGPVSSDFRLSTSSLGTHESRYARESLCASLGTEMQPGQTLFFKFLQAGRLPIVFFT